MARQRIQVTSAATRLLVALLAGAGIGAVCGWLGGARFAILASWDTVVLVYGCWVLATIWPMDARSTKEHAIRENPGRVLADILLLSTSFASFGAVTVLITKANSDTGASKVADIAVGLVSIVLSWAMVHVIYLLKYARLYYGDPEGGVEFNENDPPKYTDFAYLAFTIGMTFQVSDTAFKSKEFRLMALKHALLAYLFGAVIIAITINTLGSLSK